MKTKLTLLLAIAFLLNSSSRKEQTTLSGNEKIIYGKVIHTDGLIGRPTEIVCMDTLLLFFDRYEGKTVSVIDAKNSRFVCRLLNEGQGPGDVLPPLKLSAFNGKKILVFQMQNGRMREYNVGDLLDATRQASYQDILLKTVRPI